MKFMCYNITMNRKKVIENKFKEFIEKYHLTTSLCFELPTEFVGAFGLYDVIKNILYVNIDKKISFVRLFFTFYHELRHALQYNNPKMFSKELQQTLPYIVHFDGNCYMLKNNKWMHCIIENRDYDFLEIYKSCPYEIDANNFAYKHTMMCLKENETQELNLIYKKALPNKRIDIKDILNICEIIKNKCYN